MGVCCANEEEVLIATGPVAKTDGPKAPVVEQMKDLKEVNWQGISDIYAKFEASLPFNRISIGVMMQKIDEAEREAKANYLASEAEIAPFTTLQALRKALPTDAWRGLLDPESPLSKTLLSEFFKSEGHAADQIDVSYLQMFSLLHCYNKKKIEKATALYTILQEGGLEAHEQISAGDKDIIPVFTKLCQFVTSDIFALANTNGGASNIYLEAECKQMVNKDKLEELREDVWLDEVYGAMSRLDNASWLAKVSAKTGKASWIFEPINLRAKVMEITGIEKRH